MSGVILQVDQLLQHAINIARPLLQGHVPDALCLHLAFLVAYAIVAFYSALVLVAVAC